MIFAQEHVDAFRRLSGDENPLHVDEVYARSTQFGRVVVYGMCGVLRVLEEEEWGPTRPASRSLRLGRMKGRFHRPLHLGESYDVVHEEKSGRRGDKNTQIRVKRGAVLHTKLSFTWEDRAAEPGLPAWQRGVLAWASAYVGMTNPGRQALFSEFDLDFDEGTVNGGASFVPTELSVTEDARFHQVVITGHGPGVRRFTLTAFRRPEPIVHRREEVESVLGRSGRWNEKTVVITGTSRGFGQVLAHGFAAHGARVVGGSRSSVDLGREEDRVRWITAAGGIDVFVHNAFEYIEAAMFLDQTPAELAAFVSRAIEMAAGLLRHVLPALRPNGRVILVSTIYTRRPQAQFTHYVAAKSAAEGLVRALAEEHPIVDFWIVRPPRMLTDQSNVVHDETPPPSAVAVAKRFFDEIESERVTGSNVHEVDLL